MDIASDLDGVIANPYPKLFEAIKKQIHSPLIYEKWHDPVFENLFPELDRGWIGDLFSDPAFWEFVEPFKEAMDWMKKAADLGHRIHIVTARPESAAWITHNWLSEKSIPFHSVTLTPRLLKTKVIKEKNAKIMIEDDPRNAKAISESGIDCYIINRPYNLAHDIGEAKRVDSIHEVEI